MYPIIQDHKRIKTPSQQLYYQAGIPSRYWGKVPVPVFSPIDDGTQKVLFPPQSQQNTFLSWYQNPTQETSTMLRFLFLSEMQDDWAMWAMFTIFKRLIKSNIRGGAINVSRLWMWLRNQSNFPIMNAVAVYNVTAKVTDTQVTDIRDLFLAGPHVFLTYTGRYSQFVDRFEIYPDYAFRISGFITPTRSA